MTDKKDYKDTLFLPKTEFPMRAGLPKKEPEILANWEANKDLEKRVDARLGKMPKKRAKANFILHDGPPYANGHLHIGHALNKILKDIIVRYKKLEGSLEGVEVSYVPGWDCHGLPIEWKIEEQYRKKGKNKDEVDILDFRAECREYAKKWMEIQSEEFQRLGILGDWKEPYSTMDNRSEAIIAKELLKFATSKQLYRSSKPVYWSCVEKTALADAETEYMDKESHAIWVKFPVQKCDFKVIIWTTTPWTIPANLALSYGKDISYGIYQITQDTAEDNWVQKGEKFIIADSRAKDVLSSARIEEDGFTRLNDAPNLSELKCDHPLKKFGGIFEHDRNIIAGDFVSDDAGTGIVHIAPGHGEDDYGLWLNNRDKFPKEYKEDLPHSVQGDGGYYPQIPKFWQSTEKYQDKNNVYILKPNGKEGNANDAVIQTLLSQGTLAARGKIKHSYPHSWRSKAPLIFRNTAQWFISMDKSELRKKAILSIQEGVDFHPATGKNRLLDMIYNRPDWVVSRQRSWGVPLTLFVCKETGKILNNKDINKNIFDIFEEENSDSWWSRPPTDFFPEFDPAKYEQVKDILDVWFDSGCSHAFVLQDRNHLSTPADIYLEGTDQYRGWFQSSLLQACGTKRKAPYKKVITHGFVLDEKGEKMSKSKGNVTTPSQIIDQYGADILRLWVANSDYTSDLRIGNEIIKGTADKYRRFRNTLRWMLGAIEDYKYFKDKPYNFDDCSTLEKWAIHRCSEAVITTKKAYQNNDFSKAFNSIFDFCTNDLSSFYFDVRKDLLYCGSEDSDEKRNFRGVLQHIFDLILKMLFPICPFTVQEAWQHFTNCDFNYDEVLLFPSIFTKFPVEHDEVEKLRQVRSVVNSCLEEKRSAKEIGSSLEASPIVYIEDKELFDLANNNDFADICIVSDVTLKNEKPPHDSHKLDDINGVGVIFQKSKGKKCNRCWKILPEVDDLCQRCSDVIGQ